MNDYGNLYCKIFVDCQYSREQLVELIANSIPGKIDHPSVVAAEYEVDVRINEDFDSNKRKEFPDGFLYYPFYLDIEPFKEVEQKIYQESLSRLLEALWNQNCKAVTACDFEEELPRRGGYRWQP